MKYPILLLILFLLIPCVSDAERIKKISLDYDIQWGNLIIGKMRISLERESKLIKLQAKSLSSGALSLLYDYKSNLAANTYKEGKNWMPDSYVVKSTLRGKRYTTKINWNRKSRKVNYKIDPPLNLEKVHAISQSSLEDVNDPVTALIQVMERINEKKSCEIKLNIFDGRRRYNLMTKELARRRITNDRPKSFKGNVVICGIKITPIGGHWKESKWKPKEDKFSDIKLFFGIIENGFHYPIRMELNRWFGAITFRLLRNGIDPAKK